MSGLAYLHNRGVLHGALQPSNVLVEEDGQAVLSDFTLSKTVSDAAIIPSGSSQASSFRYQAPEISDTGVLTKSADVYSWAMTALEIVSGRASLEAGYCRLTLTEQNQILRFTSTRHRGR